MQGGEPHQYYGKMRWLCCWDLYVVRVLTLWVSCEPGACRYVFPHPITSTLVRRFMDMDIGVDMDMDIDMDIHLHALLLVFPRFQTL